MLATAVTAAGSTRDSGSELSTFVPNAETKSAPTFGFGGTDAAGETQKSWVNGVKSSAAKAKPGLVDFSSEPTAGQGSIEIGSNGFNPHSGLRLSRAELQAAYEAGRGLTLTLGNAPSIPHEHDVELSAEQVKQLVETGGLETETERKALHRHALTFRI